MTPLEKAKNAHCRIQAAVVLVRAAVRTLEDEDQMPHLQRQMARALDDLIGMEHFLDTICKVGQLTDKS